uniref:Translocator protein n=2 Tax=Meleagris gallopavo TaxID=9103 RepID=G1NLY2_MELGA
MKIRVQKYCATSSPCSGAGTRLGKQCRLCNGCSWRGCASIPVPDSVSMEVVPAWASAVGFTLLPHAGGVLGSKITRKEIPEWYESLQKPSWCPPNWVFAPVWGTLYTSMGYGSYLVWKELGGFSEKAVVPLGLYAGQLALNWAWTPIFFGAHKMGWGLATLLLTTGTATATTASWYHINRTAAYLMVPYLAWLTMASALNYRIWKDNRNKKSE